MKRRGDAFKRDIGKLRYTLLPPGPVALVVAILTQGARTYAPSGWKRTPNARTRYTDALLRHFEAWRAGERKDPESGYPHLAHVITNAIFLLWHEMRRNP